MALFGVGVSTILVMAGLLMCAQSQKTADTVKVTSILVRPYLFAVNTTDDQGNTVTEYRGYIKDILDSLSVYSGVRYELSVRKDYKFGSPSGSGGWDGMIGELTSKEANMAVGPITMSAMRHSVVEFGTSFQTWGRVFVMKKNPSGRSRGQTLEVRLGQLFSPLDDSVWLLSGFAWFVSSLVLYIICRLNPYEWRRMVRDREATMREGESFTCVNTYWFMMGAIFWQGYMRSPRSMGARIVVAFWWLYAFIFVSMYIASLTNFLRQEGGNSKIQTVEDIILDDNIAVGAIRDGSTATFYKYSKFELNKILWERMEADDLFEDTLEAGIAKVRASTPDKPYAFIAESTMAEYFAMQAPCDLYMIRDFPMTGSYGFAFSNSDEKRKDTLRYKTDKATLMIKETGTLGALEKKWFSGRCQGTYWEDNIPFHKVDLTSFSGAVIFLVIGLLFGSLVTLCEYFIYKYSLDENSDKEEERRQRKKDAMLSDKSKQDGSRGPSEPMTDV